MKKKSKYLVPHLLLGSLWAFIVLGMALIQSVYAQDYSQQTGASSRTLGGEAKHWLETTVNDFLDIIDKNRADYDQNPLDLHQMLQEHALIFWDIPLMAKALAGKNWYQADDGLKKQLESEWKRTLIRYFNKAYPYYTNQRLKLENDIRCPAKNRCWLRMNTKIAADKGIDLDFYVKKKSKKGWLIIDIRVEGVSMMRHKQAETRMLLEKEGIPGVISALRQKNDAQHV